VNDDPASPGEPDDGAAALGDDDRGTPPLDAVEVLLGVDAEPLGSDDADDEPERAPFVAAASIVVATPSRGGPDGGVPSGPSADTRALPDDPIWRPGTPDLDAAPVEVPAPAPDPAEVRGAPRPEDLDLGRAPPERVGEPGAAPVWGSRPHPPPVQAPPPPPPLAAPAAPAGRSTEPTSPPTRGAAEPPGGLQAPHVAGPGPAPEPDRSSQPRVRRWFGRASREPSDPTPEAEGRTPSRRPAPAPATRSGDPSAPTPALEPALPPEPDLGDELVDPWSLGPAVARMSAAARRAGAVSLGILSTVLMDGEVVDVVVQGTYQHQPAVVALTDRRVVVVNQRRWRPDVRSIQLTRDLVVQGWQDERQATLVFAAEGRSVAVGAVEDRPLARDLARQVRERVAARGGTAVDGP
jgi:hypothetical protein